MLKVGSKARVLGGYRFPRKLAIQQVFLFRGSAKRSEDGIWAFRYRDRSVRRLAIQARFFLGRRWPSGIPSARAFCLREPGVRLSTLEMVLTPFCLFPT